jgi:hypothetical protein
MERVNQKMRLQKKCKMQRIACLHASLLVILAGTGLPMRAQNTSPLNTAPGMEQTVRANGADPVKFDDFGSSPRTKNDAAKAAIINQILAMPAKTPELKVSGNKLVTADGHEIWLQGVNVVRLAWSGDGEGTILWSVHGAIDDWHANIIRLPVLDNLWFGQGEDGKPGNDPEVYRQIVDNAIRIAASRGAYVLLDLHRFLTPDASCVAFWKDAAARYKNNPAVLFGLFNEPNSTSWDVWQKGGTIEMKGKDGTTSQVQGVGMQALIDAVRGTGARNIVVAGGLAWAYDLTGVLEGHALDSKGGNGLMYETHFYDWHKDWSAHFMAVSAKYPVLIGETGADIHKMNFIPLAEQEDPYTWAPDAIGFIQKHRLNWTAWCFDTGATPSMLSDMDSFAPNPYWGRFVKDALAGKQFEMRKER